MLSSTVVFGIVASAAGRHMHVGVHFRWLI
jgi:hypothetical protein